MKQADVVALLALLPSAFSGSEIARNFEYYEPRCGHGSSLSRAMHAVVAARLGKTESALRFLEETAAIDLDDSRAAIAGGVHIAVQGGIWLATVMGFCGVALRDDGLAVDPLLLTHWLDVRFRLQWRGRSVHFALDGAKKRIALVSERGDAMRVYIGGVPHVLAAGASIAVSYAVSVAEPLPQE